MNVSGNKDSEWDRFLGEVAREVDGLIMDAGNLNEFQQRIRLFAEKWENHISDSARAEKERREHWKRVKNNPVWQDKKAGPPKKGWEWDRYYLSHVGIDIGPVYEMPARYAPAIITSLEGYIGRNLQKIQQYSQITMEYQNLEKDIAYQQQTLADIRTQFDELPDKNNGWISTAVPLNRPVHGPWVQFLWFRYTDLSDEEVFGCWRPPLKKIEPNPLEMLSTEQTTGKLPQANLEQEYERYYVVLTSIHDNILSGVQSISKDIWPKKLAEAVWFRFTDGQPYGPDRPFIEVAFVRVKDALEYLKYKEETERRGKFGFHSRRSE